MGKRKEGALQSLAVILQKFIYHLANLFALIIINTGY